MCLVTFRGGLIHPQPQCCRGGLLLAWDMVCMCPVHIGHIYSVHEHAHNTCCCCCTHSAWHALPTACTHCYITCSTWSTTCIMFPAAPTHLTLLPATHELLHLHMHIYCLHIRPMCAYCSYAHIALACMHVRTADCLCIRSAHACACA